MIPEDHADLNWVEDRLTGLISLLVNPDFENNRMDNLSEPLNLLGFAMLSLGESLLHDEAFQLSKSFQKKYCGLIPVADRAEESDPRLRLFVGSIECIAKASSDLAAGINRFLSALTSEAFEKTVGRYVDSKRAIRSAALPRIVLDTVFLIRENLEFERQTEGKEITPRWFVISRCTVSLATCIVEAIVPLITYCETEAVSLVKEMRAKKQVLCAAQAIQGAMLCCLQTAAVIDEAEQALFRLKVLYKTPDWPWPDFEVRRYMDQLRSCRRLLLREYAEVCCEMLDKQRDTSYPDYFGHGYCLVTDGCFDAIRDGDVEQTEHLFRHLMAMSLCAGQWIAAQITWDDPKMRALINYEILNDVIDLSGYAQTYSELRQGNHCWWNVKELWDGILNTQPRADEVVKLLLIAAEDKITGHEMAFHARALSRSRWEMRLQADLRNEGLIQGILGHTYEDSPFVRRSSSCVIDALVRTAGIAPNVGCLFGAQYLLTRPEATAELLSSITLTETMHLRQLIVRNIEDQKSALDMVRRVRRLRQLDVLIRRLKKQRNSKLVWSKPGHLDRKLRRLKALHLRLLKEKHDEDHP